MMLVSAFPRPPPFFHFTGVFIIDLPPQHFRTRQRYHNRQSIEMRLQLQVATEPSESFRVAFPFDHRGHESLDRSSRLQSLDVQLVKVREQWGRECMRYLNRATNQSNIVPRALSFPFSAE